MRYSRRELRKRRLRRALVQQLEPRMLLAAEAFATPLRPAAPIGSMIYAGSQDGAFVIDDQTNSFSITLDPAQHISVVATPIDPALQSRLTLLGPDGNVLSTSDASTVGSAVRVAIPTVTTGGQYQIDVSNLAGTGDYRIDLLLNAEFETESISATSNDTTSDAQVIDDSATPIGSGQRMAVVGAVGNGEQDLYRVSLTAGQSVSARLDSPGDAGLNLALSSEDTVRARGYPGEGGPSILNFVAPADDDYFFTIDGALSDQSYSLLVTTDLGLSRIGGQEAVLESDTTVLRVRSDGDSASADSATVELPFDHFDAGGNQWGFNGYGETISDRGDAFDYGFYPYVMASEERGSFYVAEGQFSKSTNELILGPDSVLSGVDFERRIYASQQSTFVRYLDSFTNTSGSPVSFTLSMYSDLASDEFSRLVTTSSGDTLVTPDDQWIITDALGSPEVPSGEVSSFAEGDAPAAPPEPLLPAPPPSVVHVWGGNSTLGFAEFSDDEVYWEYEVTLQPGETSIVMQFAAQANDESSAISLANDLSTLRLDSLAGMSDTERSRVVNFQIHDEYRIEADAGDELTITTITPAAGDVSPDPIDPVNDFDPILELIAPDGTVLATSDNDSGDGRNEVIEFTVPLGAAGTYRARVKSAGGEGVYAIEVNGATGTPPSIHGRFTSPNNGASFSATDVPSAIELTLDRETRADLVSTSLLSIDPSVTVTSAALIDGRTVRFEIDATDPDGVYEYSIDVGTLTDLQSNANTEPITGFFVVDTAGPRPDRSAGAISGR